MVMTIKVICQRLAPILRNKFVVKTVGVSNHIILKNKSANFKKNNKASKEAEFDLIPKVR